MERNNWEGENTLDFGQGTYLKKLWNDGKLNKKKWYKM